MIEVQNLTKWFGPKLAVDNLSFNVNKGEILGFLGPNGAGKSTTMRMITGYYPPTTGTVIIGGKSILDDPIEAKKLFGYLPENAPLYGDLSVRDFLSYAAQLRGVPKAKRSEAIKMAIETCFLEKVAHQSLETLSKGYKHRTCLAQSLIHNPEVLILDEPTDGLDPNQKHEVRQLIKRLGQDRVVIFSTHILEEVEAVCTRAIIIDQGKVVADGTPEELKKRANRAGSVLVRASGAAGAALRQALESLPSVARVENVVETDNSLQMLVYPKEKAANQISTAIYSLCKDRGVTLDELRIDEGRLDEMFREITAKERV